MKLRHAHRFHSKRIRSFTLEFFVAGTYISLVTKMNWAKPCATQWKLSQCSSMYSDTNQTTVEVILRSTLFFHMKSWSVESGAGVWCARMNEWKNICNLIKLYVLYAYRNICHELCSKCRTITKGNTFFKKYCSIGRSLLIVTYFYTLPVLIIILWDENRTCTKAYHPIAVSLSSFIGVKSNFAGDYNYRRK